MRLGLGSCVVCTAVRSPRCRPRCRPRCVLPLVGLRGGMSRRKVDGWPGIVVVVYVDCSNILWPYLSYMVEGESSRTIPGRLHLDTLDIGGVGASGSRGSDRLSHVGNRVVPRLQYHIRI